MIFRPVEASDRNYLRDSFVRGARSCPTAHGVSRELLVTMLDRVLATWRSVVLTDEDTVDEILGWACWRTPLEIFWLSVKPRFARKRLGLAQALLDYVGVARGPQSPISCPLIPPSIAATASKHGYRLVLRPYIAME